MNSAILALALVGGMEMEGCHRSKGGCHQPVYQSCNQSCYQPPVIYYCPPVCSMPAVTPDGTDGTGGGTGNGTGGGTGQPTKTPLSPQEKARFDKAVKKLEFSAKDAQEIQDGIEQLQGEGREKQLADLEKAAGMSGESETLLLLDTSL